MENLSQYKMKDFSEIQKIKNDFGEKKFTEVVNSIYDRLLQMHPGWHYKIREAWNVNDYSILIKIICLFISEGNGDYSFSDNFETIRRTKS